jgi:hypothetical protein
MLKNNETLEEHESYEKTLELYRVKNKTAIDSVLRDDISLMEKIFNTGGIEQLAIERLIFSVTSVEMLKLFLRFGGDMYMLGPPNDPQPHTLMYELSLGLQTRKKWSLLKLIKFLIEEGAYVNFEDGDGVTVFWFCAGFGQLELCKLLVDRGAEPFVTRKDGVNTLHLAAVMGHVDVCRYMAEDCGLDIEAMTSNLQTPLFLASRNGRMEVSKYLLENGADVEAGIQPLFGASRV